LKGGDLRSIGNVEEVVADIIANESLFAEVFNGMLSDDALIGMRTAGEGYIHNNASPK